MGKINQQTKEMGDLQEVGRNRKKIQEIGKNESDITQRKLFYAVRYLELFIFHILKTLKM